MSAGPGTAVAEHARRGVRLQVLLRCVLAAFVVVTVTIVAPVRATAACDVIADAYAVWAVAVGVWGWRGEAAALRLAWLALLVDCAALAALTVLAGGSARQSWTADGLAGGFFLVPRLAATQLRPEVCAAVVAPTLAVYLISRTLSKSAHVEPWNPIPLRTLVLGALGCGCIAPSWIQRSRVATIGALLGYRTRLVDELISTEARERRTLAEHLHNGALQYLAARPNLKAPVTWPTRTHSPGLTARSVSHLACCERPSPSSIPRCWTRRGCPGHSVS